VTRVQLPHLDTTLVSISHTLLPILFFNSRDSATSPTCWESWPQWIKGTDISVYPEIHSQTTAHKGKSVSS